MARLETWYKQDLKKPLIVHKHSDVFNQDSRGNLIGVEVYKDGEPVTLAGSVSGYCLLADGTTVPAVGASRSGNKASVLIPQTAYGVPGPITITIKNVEGNDITTLCAVVGLVRQSVSGNLVNPGSVVTDWSNSINAQLQAVQTAADNVGAIVAAPFDENTVYVVGNYVTNNGNLYRITADHAAGVTWADTTKVQCTVGSELFDLKSAIDTICPTPDFVWILNRNVDAVGNISSNNYMAVTDAVPVSVGDMVIRKTPGVVDNKSLIGYLSEFNGTTFIRRSSFDTYGQEFTITDPNTTHIRIAFGRTSSSGVQISQSDVDNYFKAEIYRQAVTYLDGFVNRGAVSNLGYTALAQCIRHGYYTFGSSDALTDLPTGWNGGGLLYVFATKRAVWQKIISLTNSYFRYGVTGTWYSERNYIYAVYESGSGENNSTERLNIHIPRKITNEKTVFQMGHCIDTESNANVWRIIFMYLENRNNTLRKLTMTGEWECAVHLDGRDDFSGGIVHGDEVDNSITVFVDGTVTNINAINTHCRELKVVKKSNLYDPADHTTIIAEHGIEYIYTVDGLTINQSIKWKVDATLTKCYLAMLPIIKTYSTHRYDDTSFEIVENNQTGYSIIIPDATSVTEYNTTYDTFTEMAKEIYPTGLTGGDCALITDNGGLGYNKVYFPVCSSASVRVGYLWKATTVYRNK